MIDSTELAKKITSNNIFPFIIGVSGGSGSGKTFFTKKLASNLGEQCCEVIYQDNFYHDQSEKFDFDGGSVNFDHPQSIDFYLLSEKLSQLRSGTSSELPTYDFKTHSRQAQVVQALPKNIIFVDGILIFHSPKVRSLLDHLIYFDTPEQLRFQRRLDRDIKERGRDKQGVFDQFYKQVKPMHDLYVEPCKQYAHCIVNEVSDFDEIFKTYQEKLSKHLRNITQHTKP